MTITEERPPAGPLGDSAAVSSGRERGGDSTIGAASRWRLAFRIARRESFRRPGRTVLVMLLVLVPVAAL
ncbi:MAG: hypothetical protein AAGD33_20065 [Actinomycetota bacterium]